jgi:hypothetical protein
VDKMSTSQPVLQMWKADIGVQNVKVSPVHDMKAEVHVPLFLTLALEEVSGQTHKQALYTLGKNLDNHWLGPRAGTHVLEKIKNFLLLSGT